MPLRSAGTGFDEEWLAVASHRGASDGHCFRDNVSGRDGRDSHDTHAIIDGPDDFSFDLKCTNSSGISVLSDAASIEVEEITPSSLALVPMAQGNRRRRLPILLSFLYERRSVCIGILTVLVILGVSLFLTIGQHDEDISISGSNVDIGSSSKGDIGGVSTSKSDEGYGETWGTDPISSRFASLRSAMVHLSGVSPFLSSDTAQSRALTWLADADPLRLNPDNPNLPQRYSLVVFYFATGGPHRWRNREKWLTGQSECQWYGVSCYRDGQTVDDVYLWRNGLNGIIPKEIGLLSGLQRLDLSDNKGLKDSTVSESFGLLKSMHSLHIENCGIIGTLPSTIFDLDYLEVLDVGSNQISGTLPSNIRNAISLEKLYLEKNKMTGSIPSDLGSLVLLNEIYLSENHFSGSIPSELGNLIALKALSLYSNHLTGAIPKFSGDFLEVLYLDDNELHQSIPNWINSFSKLTDLRLQRNKFNGPIPDLSRLRELVFLYLQDNDLSGSFPDWLGSLESLLEVQLFGNLRLTGSIHESISNLKELRVLHLNDCSLTGTLPRLPPSLESLNAGNNKLLGNLPGAIENPRMKEMGLYNCGFTGHLPNVSKCANLEVLNLDGNFLTGTINDSIGSLKALTKLNLSNNNLKGGIPASLGGLYQLEEVLVYANAFTGSMPLEICNLRDRGELDVLKADCDEVTCGCCTSCCTNGGSCPEQ